MPGACSNSLGASPVAGVVGPPVERQGRLGLALGHDVAVEREAPGPVAP
jgi:hypothetical protein